MRITLSRMLQVVAEAWRLRREGRQRESDEKLEDHGLSACQLVRHQGLAFESASLHACFHPAGAVLASGHPHTGSEPGFCCMIVRRPDRPPALLQSAGAGFGGGVDIYELLGHPDRLHQTNKGLMDHLLRQIRGLLTPVETALVDKALACTPNYPALSLPTGGLAATQSTVTELRSLFICALVALTCAHGNAAVIAYISSMAGAICTSTLRGCLARTSVWTIVPIYHGKAPLWCQQGDVWDCVSPILHSAHFRNSSLKTPLSCRSARLGGAARCQLSHGGEPSGDGRSCQEVSQRSVFRS